MESLLFASRFRVLRLETSLHFFFPDSSLETKGRKLADARAAASVVGARRTALAAAAMPAAAVAAAAATLGGGGGGGGGGGNGVGGVGASIPRSTDDANVEAASSSTTTAVRQPLRARILAAAGASFVSVVVVNPFDVVKTRMQAASAFRSPAFAATATGTAAAGTTAAATASASASFTTSSASSLSASAVLRSVLAKEGWRGLWRGADFALLMSLPMVGVYMPLYDDALAALRALPGKSEGGEGSGAPIARALASDAVAPALAGGAARAVAVLATSPLELARTRAQAPPEWAAAAARSGGGASAAAASLPPPPRPTSSFRAALRRLPAALPQASGPGVPAAVRAAWTGSAATLARDVPFSALYWALLEPVRSGALRWYGKFGDDESRSLSSPSSPSPSPSSCQPQPHLPAFAVVFANLVSGATAGGAAAALTTPLDVVKTKLQLEAGGGRGSGAGGGGAAKTGILSTLRVLHARGGARALFAGVGPRSARAAPACAIVVAAYELLKMTAGGSGGGGGSGSGGIGDWRDEEGLGLAAEEN